MTDLTELAKRVEAATGPSRALDHDVAVAIGERASNGAINVAAMYTGSLDSAMTLVPEGWQYWEVRMKRIGTDDPAAAAEISRMIGDDVEFENGYAATPSLALTAACLRARAAMGEG